MKTGKLLMIVALSLPLSGCYAVSDEKIAEHIDFNALPPDQAPMGYEDVLCCYDCNA